MGTIIETEKITETGQLNLVLYAVRNREGKWFRSKGYNGYGESWVEDINKAKWYSKPGVAKSQVTYWAKNYPKFGVPDLVRITSNTYEIVDQKERVVKAINRIQTDELKRKKERVERYIRDLRLEEYQYGARLLELQRELDEINDNLTTT